MSISYCAAAVISASSFYYIFGPQSSHVDPSTISYLTFGIVLILAVIFDLGLLSRKGTAVTIKRALIQTAFWVGLAMAFFGFLWYEDGHKIALEYFSAYLMEWSLSIDNIFVFILIFTFFRVKAEYYARVLLIGILMAIVLRIIFITVGIALVARFHWLLYIFGGILIYTGISMFATKHDEGVSIEDNRVYKFLKRFLPLTGNDGGGKMTVSVDGRKRYTTLFVVVVLLATTDIVFAVDSIPAVFGITQEKIVKVAPAYLDNLNKAAGVEITDADLKAAAAAAAASAASASSGNLRNGVKRACQMYCAASSWEVL